MSVIGVIYYQARCDLCGGVDDQGEYTAWVDPEQARFNAAEGGGWAEFGDLPGEDPQFPLMACSDCAAPVESCVTCDDDLDPRQWARFRADHFTQTCPSGHLNHLTLTAEETP